MLRFRKLLAVVLSVMMVLLMLPVSTQAAEESAAHIHCMCGAVTTEDTLCGDCGTVAVEWTGISAMPAATEPGCYYLEADISVAPFVVSSGDFAFCLCGHDMTSAAGKRMFEASGESTLSFTDCTEDPGMITGTTGATAANGTAIRINAGAVMNVWSVKITDHTGTNKDGLIFLDMDKTGTYGVGGTFNMYSGEISGNTVRRGAVYATLATGTQSPAVVRILGGTITGNTGVGTGNSAGGAGIYGLTDIEVGGDAKIYGNTSASGPADVYIRDDQGAKLVISDTKPLSDGANICYGTKNTDDSENLQFISGEPDALTWNNAWISYDGRAVKYRDGKFYTAADIVISGHDHDGKAWISVSEETQLLPEKSGCYVLDGDVKLQKVITLTEGQQVLLCLNGHTLTAGEGDRHFNLMSGSQLTICDCTATGAGEAYTAGKLTGGTGNGGGAIRVYGNAVLVLEDGILTGNSTEGNGGAVYLEKEAAFRMTGGQICKNTGAFGGAIRFAAGTDTEPAATFVMEGGWICHNESPDRGGALHAAGGASIALRGGIIEGNTAATNGGAISINGATTVDLSGTVIRDNAATTRGGGLFLSSGAILNMTGGEISGNSAKVGGGILTQNEGTTVNLSAGTITGNQAGEGGGAGIYASTGTAFNMSGGEVSNNTSEVGGGGMVLVEMTANITGGKISGNKGSKAGAGLCVQGAEVYLGNVVISENVSTASAGGIYVTRAGETCANVMIDGAEIISNKANGNGGGMSVYMNGNTVTMKSGKINYNAAKDGGGVLVQRECTFTMNGGEICSNTTTSGGGGGYYASVDSTFIMNGGLISGNYSETSGGGVFCVRAKAQFNGGSISHNTANTAAGGVYVNGSKAAFNGTWVTNNRAKTGSCGGVMVNSVTHKVDGVATRFASYVSINAGSISYNTTPKAGAGLLVQARDSVVDMYGGKISYNTATKFAGGVYVGVGAAFNMHGGEISYNVTEKDVAGGIRHDGGNGHYTGGEIHHNMTTRSGGGIVVGGKGNNVTLKNVKIYANEAKLGGGLVLQGQGSELKMENCEVYDNLTSQDGAGIYVSTYVKCYMNDCHFHHNITQTNGGGVYSWATSYVYLTDCLIENNEAKAQGGGVWTRGDGFTITGSKIRQNTAGDSGGGIYVGQMGAATYGYTPGMEIGTTEISNNISGGQGGGLYQAWGALCKLSCVDFTANRSVDEGSAFWVKDELTMHQVSTIGNCSENNGHAVYMAGGEYDGHSYVAGLMTVSGDIKVYDNEGGNLYLGAQTPMVAGQEGLGADTHIEITMAEGLLTDWFWGAYDYEGGDLVYTITYGDRSITDPEDASALQEETPVEEPTEGAEPTEAPTEGEKTEPKGNTGLIVGIAAIVAVIAAAAVIIVVAASRKKKVAK